MKEEERGSNSGGSKDINANSTYRQKGNNFFSQCKVWWQQTFIANCINTVT